ncbi:hypothetical protein RchiOBHm_Chr6g0271511 [Rosa chinensis]|uniref:Uncharacterized protein n=1 Tax=Rosa chinensis TaxID=74649 RepID=A0A2P6PR00_ROSCH|nr:hypothetical protein RchiOBHm_Chr6g0271511 [Rosa chinensis]
MGNQGKTSNRLQKDYPVLLYLLSVKIENEKFVRLYFSLLAIVVLRKLIGGSSLVL